MENNLYYGDEIRIKVYDDGKVTDIINIDFYDDYNYTISTDHNENYDYDEY